MIAFEKEKVSHLTILPKGHYKSILEMDPVIDELRQLQKKIRLIFTKNYKVEQVIFTETTLQHHSMSHAYIDCVGIP